MTSIVRVVWHLVILIYFLEHIMSILYLLSKDIKSKDSKGFQGFGKAIILLCFEVNYEYLPISFIHHFSNSTASIVTGQC